MVAVIVAMVMLTVMGVGKSMLLPAVVSMSGRSNLRTELLQTGRLLNCRAIAKHAPATTFPGLGI